MMTYLLIFGAFMVASWLVSHKLKSKYKKYSLLLMNNGYTGRDVLTLIHSNFCFAIHIEAREKKFF